MTTQSLKFSEEQQGGLQKGVGSISSREIIFIAFLSALLVNLIVGYINYSWFHRAPEGWVYLGTLQSDMQTYTSIFRELFENGNGFFYGSPQEIREELAPAIFIQFPFIILGWFWCISNLSIPLVWEIFRILMTFLFSFSLAFLLRCFFSQRRWFIVAFIFSVFGSGSIVFLVALFRGTQVPPTPDGLTSYLASYYYAEQALHWWGLHLFRNFFYPVELLIHSFFFLTLYYLIKQRYHYFALFFFLTWFSGLFAALELSGIVTLFLMYTYFKTKEAKRGKALLAVLLISLLFIIYYKVFIPSYPVGKSLDVQHTSFTFPPLTFYDYVVHYSWLLLFLVPSLFFKDFRRFLQKNIYTLLFIWIGVVFLFSQNDKLLPGAGIQPPHFLRGYLFMALAILTIVWFRWFSATFPQKGILIKVATVILLCGGLTDSALFSLCMYYRIPHPEVSTVRQQTVDVLHYLNTWDGTRHIVVLSQNRHLDVVINSQTTHRSFLSDIMATPFWEEKIQTLQNFLMTANEGELVETFSVDTIIAHKDFFTFMNQWTPNEVTIELEYENALWRVYSVVDKE